MVHHAAAATTPEAGDVTAVVVALCVALLLTSWVRDPSVRAASTLTVWAALAAALVSVGPALPP